MKRALIKDLIEWKNRADRQPLILRGVRQCGKTYLLKEFGALHYENTAYFNFEDMPSLAQFFEQDLDVKRILFELSLMAGETILPGKTLLIFDEIQECGKALTALKYFCEKAPEYHVVCAGSFLGIALHRNLSFPVGKVDFLTLRPMNFAEFVRAQEGDLLADFLEGFTPADSVSRVVCEKLDFLLRRYFAVGGMPAAVDTWLKTQNLTDVERVQQGILDSYAVDFMKHAPLNEFPKLTAIWRSIPEQLAKENAKFIFSHVKVGWRAKDLEDALEWLIAAGLVHKVCRIERPSMPLSSYANQTAFKLYLADVGLLRKLSRVPSEVLLETTSTYKEFKGALTENYVLNELVSVSGESAYYWTSGNLAEVDFIMQRGRHIVPIEVKAGRSVKSRSLAEYRKRYAPEVAVKTSLREEVSDGGLVTLPLYVISALFHSKNNQMTAVCKERK